MLSLSRLVHRTLKVSKPIVPDPPNRHIVFFIIASCSRVTTLYAGDSCLSNLIRGHYSYLCSSRLRMRLRTFPVSGLSIFMDLLM